MQSADTGAPVPDDRPIDLSDLPQPFCADRPRFADLWRFAWQTAAKHVRTSRGRRHMDAAWDPNRNCQWVWDTCFMALYCRYAPAQFPGVQSLDNFYELQRDDGYIGMTYDMTTGEEPWPDRINPPLFAWVEWEHYLATGDSSRFARVVPCIERLMDWIEANRRTRPHKRRAAAGAGEVVSERGDENYRLYYFEDCGSSGMDDSPRTPRYAEAGRFFDWIDLSSQMVLSFRILASMRSLLGDEDAAARWLERAETVSDLVNEELWCERTRFYHDRCLPDNYVMTKTVASFWPMLAGVATGHRLDALVGHLMDEREFNRRIPVATLSADDGNFFSDGTYWRGGVWAPTNYMIARGLMRSGRGDAAHAIALKYLDGLVRTYDAVEPHTLWECNSSEADAPGIAAGTRKRVKPDFVGWSGLGPIAMLIENVLGVDIDAPNRRIHWDVRLTGEHGVRGLRVGGAPVDLLCQERSAADEPAVLSVKNGMSEPLRIVVRRGDAGEVLDVPPGDSRQASV